MKNYLVIFITCCFVIFTHSQEKRFNIEWIGTHAIETAYGKKELPVFDSTHFSYDETKGITYFAQWEATNGDIDEKSVSITNISYEIISSNTIKDLNKTLIPKTPNFNFYNTNARGKKAYFLEIAPIINAEGVYKRITAFSIKYNQQSHKYTNALNKRKSITNSVLSTGDWYRFYIDQSGVFKLTKRFLSSLGINTNSVDPRTIKIYGNGGRMLPLSNAANYPFDVVENAIKFVGEDDGSFDNEDYILFYGEGPNTYNSESDTNINLYTDKTYYYVNVGAGNGKRIQPLSTINSAADIQINTFQDYQFYEVDDYNIAKLGRKWFGDEFDVENERVYEFNFPNLVINEPIDFRVSVGAVSETQTSMAVFIDENAVTSLNLSAADFGSTLASGNSYSNQINVTSDVITVRLNYDNGGNPSANAFLDFITIEATRDLTYTGGQLLFKNNIVNNTPGIAEYIISNASTITEVWDITDRFNSANRLHTNNQSTLSFKAQSGEERTYIAFSNTNTLQPQRDAITTVANQNLKGTLFNDEQGNFEAVDYIIITPTILSSQAERLAQINRDVYGLSVRVVELNKIYAEFSTGSQDIAAIRNFIKYVYDNASSEANRLKYLCLFGDGSYDYKNRINNNTNIVPSWYSIESFNLTNSFVSDDFYGMLDDNEGSMSLADRLDIAVGRILVEDLQRAKEIVDKIEAYHQSESYGDWRNNVLLISDDVDEEWEEILQRTTDDIATTIETQSPYVNVVKIHSDAFQQEASSAGDRYPKVNSAIRDAIEVGALVVNYFGHGGEDGLAKERIFDQTDAQDVNNRCKFNLFVTVTCEYTKFDDPNRPTAGEFTFWNTNGGAVALITTTRQIFVSVGVAYNLVLNDYLFPTDPNNVTSVAEALRLAKTDNSIAGISQKRLTFFIGDPAMKLAFPKPEVKLTHVNDIEIAQLIEPLEALSSANFKGEVVDANGNLLSNYNGVLTTTIFDKRIDRQTLANDDTVDNDGLIVLDFTTLGEIIFKGQATIANGQFEFNFIVPRDIGIPVGNGKVSFYAKTNNATEDQTGASFDVKIGGINENAPEDNIGPVINLFMNDENFISGGITNEAPTLLVKLHDENGINTASGIGHDITAIIDDDETAPINLNNYYEANVDDYTNGIVTYPFRDLEPGFHTLTLKAWDVYNNSSIAEIEFNVFDDDEELVINNVLNYPNPFVNYTEFWFNHNSAEVLDISVQIFTISGKLVRTLNGQTTGGSKSVSSLSKDIIWDGRDDFGEKIGKGVYIYKLKVKSNRLNKQVEKIEKLVIL